MAASLALRGKFRREKCNMLQKSLAEMALRVNIGKKKAKLEEICSICYIISCKITLMPVYSAFQKNNIVKLLVLVRILLNANGSAIIKSVL